MIPRAGRAPHVSLARRSVQPAVKTVPLPVVALLVVLFGAFTGHQLLESANDPVPTVLDVLHAHADPPEAPAGPPTHRVVIVVIDGLGAEPFETLVDANEMGAHPDFRAYIDVGAPSLSRAVYHQLLTGVPQSVSGIRSNAHQGRARADDLAARVRASGGSVAWALESVTWFHDLFGSPVDSTLLGGAVRNVDRMVELYESGADLIVWHLIRVDLAGHAHGAASDAYRDEARDAVRLIRSVRDRVASHPDAARTVWFLGADHGHMPGGGHGGPEAAVRDTLWAGWWPTHPSNAVVIPTYVPATRLAATFARALGVSAPREALGDPLPLPGIAFAALPHRAAREQAVRIAFEQATQHARRAVSLRALLAIGLLAIGCIAIVRAGRGRELAGATLVVAAAALGFVVLGSGFTLSAIRTHASFLARSILAMGAGSAIVWPLARRVGARAASTVLASAVPSLIVLVASAASLGRSSADAIASLLYPTSGLLTAGVVLGVFVGELGGRFRARRTRSGPIEEKVASG